MTVTQRPPRIASLKPLIALQVFLLRRNWMGPAGNFLMVITTLGRKSGKNISAPISYLRDGETILGFSIGGASNWYKNALVNPDVTLEIKGEKVAARVVPITDLAEKQKVFERYLNEPNFKFIFKKPDSASLEDLAKLRDSRVYVRFHPTQQIIDKG